MIREVPTTSKILGLFLQEIQRSNLDPAQVSFSFNIQDDHFYH